MEKLIDITNRIDAIGFAACPFIILIGVAVLIILHVRRK